MANKFQEFICALFICVIIQYSDADCNAWEGQSHNLSCSNNISDNQDPLTWSILNLGPRVVISCKSDGCTCNDVQLCQHISTEGCNKFNCTLQFQNVSRMFPYTWACAVGGFNIRNYNDFENICAYPKPAKDVSCPTGLKVNDTYILKGTNASCVCKVEIPGIPYGNVQWFNTLLGVPANQSYRDNGTNLNIEYKDKGNSFVCKGISPANNSSNKHFDIIYTPEFAYGPESENIYLTVNSSNKLLQICNNETIGILVSCQVAIADVNPSPQFSVYLENDVMPEYVQGYSKAPNYSFGKNITLNKGGANQIICSVKNLKFGELLANQTKIVLVNEPPADPPSLYITDLQSVSTNSYSVVENSTFNILCRVEGGTPNVANVTVTCGSWNKTNDSNFVSKQLTFNRYNKTSVCSCKSWHITRCYNKQSEIFLDVVYAPEILAFTGNSQSVNLTVQANASVSFLCLTDSNPKDLVILYNMNKQLTTNNNITTTMYCNSSGEYMCYAKNNISSSPTHKNLTVAVECAHELQNVEDNYSELYAEINRNASFKINVFGYPAPLYYTLYKQQQKVVNVSVLKPENDNKYNFVYSMDILPIGHVNVTIYNITKYDFTNYTLNIYNGIQFGLNYSFVLLEGNIPPSSPTSENVILPAVVGTLACFVILILLLLAVIKCFYCMQHTGRNYQQRVFLTVQECKNDDLYFVKSQETSDFGLIYKNYSDVATTITSAAALPKNLKLERNEPDQCHQPRYFNTLDDFPDCLLIGGLDKHRLIHTVSKLHDKNVYINTNDYDES